MNPMPEETDGGAQMVPLSRLNSAIEARKAIEAELREAKAKIAELQPLADGASAMSEALEAEKAARAEDAARFTAREAFLGAGIKDSEEMDILRSRWDALPKKDRPSLSHWLAEGAKEDKIASRFLPQADSAPAQPPADAAPAADAPAAERPKVTHAGAAPTPPAAPAKTREAYYAAMNRATTSEERARIVAEYREG